MENKPKQMNLTLYHVILLHRGNNYLMWHYNTEMYIALLVHVLRQKMQANL